MRPFKISIHNRKGVGLEFDFDEGHLLVRFLHALAKTFFSTEISNEELDFAIYDITNSLKQKHGHQPNVEIRRVNKYDDHQTWNQN